MKLGFEYLFLRNYRWFWHAFFWGFVLGLYTLFFGHQKADYYPTFLFVCLLLPITILTLYFLIYFLIPHFLFQKKYKLFALLLAYTLVVSVWLEFWMMFLAFVLIGNYQVENMTPASLDIVFLMVGLYMVVCMGIAIKLFKHWYEAQQKNQQITEAKLQTELRLKEAELKLLKAQIHPHFLFNTLNSLYGLTLEKSELAPEVVIQLADLLDYLLYRCNTPYVMLEDEWKHITTFMSLEKLRYGERLEIQKDMQGNMEGKKIAPMLLLPFVENCFKHGVSRHTKECWIQLFLKIEQDRMYLKVSNSQPTNQPKSEQDYTEGIGLSNVKKRLELLYAGRYELMINDLLDFFEITLIITF